MMSLHSALRAQMGVAVPALSIPKEESRSSEPCLLFFGIVDFLQVCLACRLKRSCSKRQEASLSAVRKHW